MSISDRELLELAAKAAGYDVRWHDNWKCFVHNGPHNIDSPPTAAGERHVWVPLHDDGDALRLAVKLGIKVRWSSVLNQALAWPCAGHTLEMQENGEAHAGDQFAATRRAIVRAAAEIGKSMQEKAK